jgi:dihydrolipoamide dehydrogenase
MADRSGEFDMVVIGGGPGGYAAALYGGAAGLSVGLVEKAQVGGTCLHRGCVPAKEFLETASVYRTVRSADEFGISTEPVALDFARSAARKRRVVDQLHTGLQGLLKKRRVVTFAGTGTLQRDRRVTVTAADGSVTELGAKWIVLASGSVPRTIPGFDVDGRFILTSDEFLSLERLPASAVVIGGGAIGCEFASTMADLGTQVTLLEAMDSILPGCDGEVADVVARSFSRRGINVRTSVAVRGHQPKGGVRTSVSFEKVVARPAGGAVEAPEGQAQPVTAEEVTVEAVVVAVGRRPFSDGLLAPDAGVETTERGFVKVGANMETTSPGVFAVGDLVDTPQLAHVGFAEAIVAVKTMLGEPVAPLDYSRVPWCIYCHPEAAFAGLTEAAAKEAGFEVVTHKTRFSGNSRAMIIGETEGMVKVIAERGPDGRAGRILGVHMAGPWATEQLGQGYLAVNWEALPEEAAAFIQPHPTLSETFGEAMLALSGRGLH